VESGTTETLRDNGICIAYLREHLNNTAHAQMKDIPDQILPE